MDGARKADSQRAIPVEDRQCSIFFSSVSAIFEMCVSFGRVSEVRNESGMQLGYQKSAAAITKSFMEELQSLNGHSFMERLTKRS